MDTSARLESVGARVADPDAAPALPAEERASRLSPVEVWVLLATVVASRLFSIRACPIYDDAFITYRYARNLAHGAGLVFNPGAAWEPVLGTTTPLYALVLAPFARMGVDLVAASLALNIACDAIACWLLVRALDGRRIAGSLCALAFAGFPYVARISVGGMESPLFAALALGACASFANGRAVRAGWFAALTCVARPEGVLLVAVLALFSWRNLRNVVRFAIPVAITGAVTIGALTLVYGSFVPQSVRAKAHMHAWEDASMARHRWVEILAQSFLPHPVLVVVLPLVAIGLARALARPGALRTFSCFALAITASYLAARPHTWGWYFYVPLIAWTAWVSLGAESAVAWAAKIGRRPAWARWNPKLVYAAAAVVVLLVGAVGFLFPSRVGHAVYDPMQAWARETSAREPSARILAADIGALGYAWSGTVLDSEGLTWPKAIEYGYPNAIIRAEAPEYLMIVAERPRMEAFYRDANVREQYVAVRRFSIDGRTELEPAIDGVSATWVQDYLVYARRSR